MFCVTHPFQAAHPSQFRYREMGGIGPGVPDGRVRPSGPASLPGGRGGQVTGDREVVGVHLGPQSVGAAEVRDSRLRRYARSGEYQHTSGRPDSKEPARSIVSDMVPPMVGRPIGSVVCGPWSVVREQVPGGESARWQS